MITKSEIIENVLVAIRKTKDASFRLMVEQFLQKQVFMVSEMHSFHKLRQVIELDLTDSGELPYQGVWLPSNLAGIDVVRDEDGRDLVRRDEAHIDPDENTFRFFTYVPSMNPLFVGDDLLADQGVGHFQSAQLDAAISSDPDLDPVGEWCRFNTEYGFYQITENDGGQYKIAPVYHGQSLSQVHFEVRPRGTQKLVVVKPNEDQVISGKVRVYYWTYHPPLHLDSDVIMFPHAGLVESIVLREALNNLGRRQLSSDKYIRDINEAWIVTRRLNPAFPRQTGPRGRDNKTFEMNRSLFRRRE
jgi:hypothetical protein